MSESGRSVQEYDALESYMKELGGGLATVASMGTLQGVNPDGFNKVKAKIKEMKFKVDDIAPKVDNMEKGIQSKSLL